MRNMKRNLAVAGAFVALFTPCCAWSCDGPGSGVVAVSCDGAKCTVTNSGRSMLAITFAAWGQNYSLSLAPGQSGTPANSGWLNLPMKAYQSCTTTVLPSR
jgi:hypothetical protein